LTDFVYTFMLTTPVHILQMYAYSILREPLLGYLCDAVASLVRSSDKELNIRWEVKFTCIILVS